jgi:hypothetical protein
LQKATSKKAQPKSPAAGAKRKLTRAEKKISCRLVRLNATFVFTFVKSLGTGTYAKKKPPFISGRERLTLQVRRS